MPSNQNIDVFQYTGNSGQNLSGTFTANVPLNESTGGQLQAAAFTEIVTASGFQSVAYELNAVENASIMIGLGQSGSNPGGPTLFGTTPPVILPALGISGNVAAGGVSISGIIPVGIVVQGIVANSGIGINSGFTGNQLATIWGSGFTAVTASASQSGGAFNAPAGTFTIQVLGMSGNPYFKVPFYNS